MKKIIHHIRKQSKEDRRHILHILIFCAAVILILLWVYSLGATLSDSDARAEISEDLRPFATLKDSITSPW